MTPPSSEEPVSAQDKAREAFALIGRQARDSNLHRIDQLEKLASHAATEALSEAERRAGRHLSHTLLGSAGTFGFPAVTEPARLLETLFVERVGPHEAQAVTTLLKRIRTALVASPTEVED